MDHSVSDSDQRHPRLMVFDPLQQHTQCLFVAECGRDLSCESFIDQPLTCGSVRKETWVVANTFDLSSIDKGQGIRSTCRDKQ